MWPSCPHTRPRQLNAWHATRCWRNIRELNLAEVVIPARPRRLGRIHSASGLSTVGGEDVQLLRRDSRVTLDSRVTMPPPVSMLQGGCQHNSLNQVKKRTAESGAMSRIKQENGKDRGNGLPGGWLACSAPYRGEGHRRAW